MKLITDNAFSKTWEVNCSSCKKDKPNSILWFRKKCVDCQNKDIADKKYTKEDIINIVNKSRETGLTPEYLILQLKKQE